MANQYVNKVVLGSETLLDLTADTATAADVAQGKTFHLASGATAVGTASTSGGGMFYGTCATAAATAAKAVVCEEFTADDLVEGAVVIVKFTNAQTYNGAPTLNVNSTGAKNIKRYGTTNAARYEWLAGEVLTFVYDGTYWIMSNGGIATTTYYGMTKLSSATNSTSAAVAATASAVKAAYDLANGKQDELVSGTNIKTINGNSLLGSGDLAIGGGGVSVTTATVTIAPSDWYPNLTCTKTATGATTSNSVIVSYEPSSRAACIAADVYCLAQGTNSLTFKCAQKPSESVTLNIMILD